MNRINPLSMDWALLAVRLVVGSIFLVHGSQKMFGAFGGPGLGGVVQWLGPVGYLVAIAEFFGGLAILVGFLARFSALALVGVMIGAIGMVHWQNGFFAGPQAIGIEWPLALIGNLLAIALGGPGAFSLGRVLTMLPRRRDGVRPVLALE